MTKKIKDIKIIRKWINKFKEEIYKKTRLKMIEKKQIK